GGPMSTSLTRASWCVSGRSGLRAAGPPFPAGPPSLRACHSLRSLAALALRARHWLRSAPWNGQSTRSHFETSRGPPPAQARRLRPGEALVAARDEVRLDLVRRFEGDADDDDEARAAELERHVEHLAHHCRDDANRGEVDRAADGDARDDAVDV